jgi:hypothetical protein
MAGHQMSRMNHSAAILLPDGRVFTIGGEEHVSPGNPTGVKPNLETNPRPADTVELFSPPYHFKGVQYRWVSNPPKTMPYGQAYTFQVECNENLLAGGNSTRVVLMRPGTITHSCDFDQRYASLEPSALSLVGTNQYQVTLTAPLAAHAGACSPGWYILFVVSPNGIPSPGKFVKVF